MIKNNSNEKNLLKMRVGNKMNSNRIKLQDLILERQENELLGNFTSVRGEYYIPQIGKTGFYKENGCMLEGNEEEDLRELVASKIMEKIDFPHAIILLASNEENKNGCISVNILNKNENFKQPKSQETKYKPINNIEDWIKSDLEQISTISGITSEDLDARKEYLIKYLFVSALISNTDVKMDNMLIIKNSDTGEFRNPEYYDMGVSFIESNNRKFFHRFSSNQIIQQLYKQYPKQIVPFGRIVQKKLTVNDIEELLTDGIYSDTFRQSIVSQLYDRIDLIEKLNIKEQKRMNKQNQIQENEGTKDEVEDESKKTETQMQEVNNSTVNLWMNRFSGWYGSIDRVPKNVKSKFVKMKSDIVKAISGKIKERSNEQEINKNKHQNRR